MPKSPHKWLCHRVFTTCIFDISCWLFDLSLRRFRNEIDNTVAVSSPYQSFWISALAFLLRTQLQLLIIWLWPQRNQTSQVAIIVLVLTMYHFKVFWCWYMFFKKTPPFDLVFASVVSRTRLLWSGFI